MLPTVTFCEQYKRCYLKKASIRMGGKCRFKEFTEGF